jgi:hypothetical protein
MLNNPLEVKAWEKTHPHVRPNRFIKDNFTLMPKTNTEFLVNELCEIYLLLDLPILLRTPRVAPSIREAGERIEQLVNQANHYTGGT